MPSSPAERPLLIQTTSHGFTPEAHPTVFRLVGGLAGSFRQVVLELDDNAYVESRLSSETRADLRARGIAVHRVDRARLHHEEYVRWLLAGIVRRYGPPFAIVAQLGNNGWRSLALAAHAKVPLATLFHGGDARVGMLDERFRERFERLVRLPGSHLGGVSRNVVHDLEAWGVPNGQTFLQHHGVDLAPFKPPDRAAHEDGLRIVMAGRFVPFKDHATGLRAFASHHSRHPQSRLHLYGDGPLETAARELAAELGVGDAVHFEGLVPVQHLIVSLGEADVALQPSRTDAEGHAEGIPTTVLEAMAMALPVVATKHAGIPEAVSDGETGLLADEGDAEALASALDLLAAEPARRLALGRAGRARIEAEFEVNALGQRFAEQIHGWRDAYDALPASERASKIADATGGWEQPIARHGLRRRAMLRARIAVNRLAGGIDDGTQP
ncbi:MAG: glycosyltransferase [bacterium]|nr:glycosyltransferase [bacterium]